MYEGEAGMVNTGRAEDAKWKTYYETIKWISFGWTLSCLPCQCRTVSKQMSQWWAPFITIGFSGARLIDTQLFSQHVVIN
jgi:hypothetical protein